MPGTLHHAILGAGGIGGLMGACLVHSGAGVTMVVRRETVATFPRVLHLESPFGDFNAEVACSSEVPRCDVLWLATKATQLESALASLSHPDSVNTIVPLLNGIDHLKLLRSRYGQAKVIAATIAVESERVAPGHIIHRTPFVRLNVSTAGQALLGPTLDELRKIGFECKFIADEATLMWSKIVFLAPFALTTTASDRTTGAVIADRQWRSQLESCVREACSVAIAEGAKLDADAVIAAMMEMPPNMRSSMQKDVAQGNPPELEAIAGPIINGARRRGFPAPVTASLVAAIERRMSLQKPA